MDGDEMTRVIWSMIKDKVNYANKGSLDSFFNAENIDPTHINLLLAIT